LFSLVLFVKIEMMVGGSIYWYNGNERLKAVLKVLLGINTLFVMYNGPDVWSI